MKKNDFINHFSKVNKTFDDEFKAEFNSPELLWVELQKIERKMKKENFKKNDLVVLQIIIRGKVVDEKEYELNEDENGLFFYNSGFKVHICDVSESNNIFKKPTNEN